MQGFFYEALTSVWESLKKATLFLMQGNFSSKFKDLPGSWHGKKDAISCHGMTWDWYQAKLRHFGGSKEKTTATGSAHRRFAD
ncbi:hypothetical protein RY831_13720 [Noviherbaspirillum sp. CPCC 100848]|uniref:Uncharacterized protein n=1 Tax=Noviherbaspirillum album TaxID=3080276 RepID=A0ABU6J9V3_9BURK|nr:hypothetical protein [Noviherbaspirillum sp. CPCC 100848]MEC4720216.1 hypothetical protein [Noviherbaspirillum sp. CPCC 100848]